VHNPWDLTRIAGGSSGGSAAAVASGEVFASFGSDSGGSIRVPASMCGVVGLKPTYGRISLHGLVGAAWSIDHVGPIARTVQDVALLYEVTAGFDSNDPRSSHRPIPPVVVHLEDDIKGLRVGVIQDGSMGKLDRDVEQSFSSAAQRLAQTGIVVDSASLVGLGSAPAVTAVIAYSEVGAHHRRWIRERTDEYGDDTRPLMQLGQLFSASQYLAAQRARGLIKRITSAALRPFDVLMLPTAPIRAPRLSGVIDDDSTQDPHDLFTLMRFAVPFSLAGLPAVTVPAGTDSMGLPMGVQFVAAPYQESTLLRVARAYERAADWAPIWPTRLVGRPATV
jgi:aspartyl-tRNA(Asn)/glutamyl-tRNA(Gln) amidotransferase subunit A